MEIKIGNTKFKSKTEAERFIRQKINHTYFDEKDPFWAELIELHPEREQKKGPGIIKFIRKRNFKNDFEMHFIRADNTGDHFSWYSCLRQKPKTPRDNLVAAMRVAIRNQCCTFRNNRIKVNDACEVCLKKLVPLQIHVDHFKPTFKSLSDFFIDGWELALPREFDSEEVTNRAKFKQEDKEFEASWKKYHKDVAELRLLCSSCNLKRSKNS